MDAYEYALMKETLERIQKHVTAWRNDEEGGSFDTACDEMYEIENILMEAGFDE
jgi:hypothetical protein